MTDHTYGSWEAHGAHVYAGKNCIAICDTDNDNKERYEANARLIAAAPDLLAALQAVDDDCKRFGEPTTATRKMFRAAIARATGAA